MSKDGLCHYEEEVGEVVENCFLNWLDYVIRRERVERLWKTVPLMGWIMSL